MISSLVIVLPIGIAWVSATVLALADGRRPLVGWLAVAGLGASFASSVWLLTGVIKGDPVEMVAGGWPPGVGIVLRADALGATFAAVSLGVIFVSLLYEVLDRITSRTFPAVVSFLAAGLSGLFLTGDVFNFYVFFEISMTAAYVITGYREQDYQVRAAFIFAIVNLLGSVLFLISAAALYHVTGTLQMSEVAARMVEVTPNSATVISAMIFAAFCLKLGIFPFHFWLPAVYIGSHAPVAAILSGALANIGSYGLLRFGAEILPQELKLGAAVVMALGSASIVYGALQAVSRRAPVEVMAYSTIGQVGYILVALGIGGRAGLAAAVIYAVVNSLNKTLIFLSVGLRGPLVGAAFAVGAFSIAGVPPVAGFMAKLAVFRASIGAAFMDGPVSVAGATVLVALIFIGGALSFVYSFQVYQRFFLLPPEDTLKPGPLPGRLLVAALAALVIAAGIWPEPLVALGETSAATLLGGGG